MKKIISRVCTGKRNEFFNAVIRHCLQAEVKDKPSLICLLLNLNLWVHVSLRPRTYVHKVDINGYSIYLSRTMVIVMTFLFLFVLALFRIHLFSPSTKVFSFLHVQCACIIHTLVNLYLRIKSDFFLLKNEAFCDF